MIESPENEAAVLGSIILDRNVIPVVKKWIDKDSFYRPEHQLIWQGLMDINPGADVDIVLLRNELSRAGALKDVGGVDYLVAVAESVPSSASAEYYAKEVHDTAQRRKIEAIGMRIKEFNGELVAEQLAEIKSMLAEIKPAKTGLVKVGDCTEDALEEIEKGDYGIKTGLTELDVLTGGLKPGNMIVIAGRPSMGKTALGLNITAHVAMDSLCVMIFSLEMTQIEITQRLIYSFARERDDIVKLAAAATEVKGWNIVIAEGSMLTVDKIQAIASANKPDLIIIDYLQLLWEPSVDSRYQQVSLMSRKIKVLAQELQVPVIVISQLNRGPESRTNHKPMMSDLRDSGAVEQDADIVLLLYREQYYKRDTDIDYAEIIVGKNRNGDTRFVKVAWHPKYVRFDNY